MNEKSGLTTEQLSLLIGIMLGQVSFLNFQINHEAIDHDHISRSLRDIQDIAEKHIRELYMKEEPE